ncbi:SDR family oxidoreductase [Hymenobacter weizhouensis]|uniref:SDR family oxidoreductase n=1 Tax=Hymenobacter sp. YIM 151500-1 TaxID=2987689 RepID=UPI002226396E|nr:SDR family oxidoreductase [Hymenobacter sp. YIM 151500-1]UYZ62857.1 SDR family oxidoreductase [Hymenobacter sp. YIM 151500-1]
MSTEAPPVALVTGATSGIGEITARDLARYGYHVVLLARNADKAELSRRAIARVAGPDRVSVVLCDLSDLEQVRRAATEFQATYPRLDLLINNAGLLFGTPRQVSKQGFEMTLATNHLGHFLLTALLLDHLRRSPAARVINVASMGYKMAKPRLDDLNQERGYSPMRQYANTKLYNILFTQELARRLRERNIQNVITHSLHPGVVATGFGQQSGGLLGWGVKLARPFLLSPEKGAETTLFLALDPAAGNSSGGFFAKKRAEPVQHPFNTPENVQALWEQSEQMVGQRFF